jgi:hypothetical protein
VDEWRHSFLTSALGRSEWLASGFGRFNQEERDFVIRCVGSCLSSSLSVDTELKSTVLEAGTAELVKSVYTSVHQKKSGLNYTRADKLTEFFRLVNNKNRLTQHIMSHIVLVYI